MPMIQRGRALPRTKYLVTVKDGRLGKARQIAPFEIEVKALHGDWDKIEEELARHIARYCKTKGIWTELHLPPDTAAYYGAVYTKGNPTLMGMVRIDRIEESTEEDTK